ncbi:MAG TPA: glycosyltransferase [Gemmataceae bacterium]|nr:glycosyltransferase [Gemmataceae bacterium]
MGHTWLSVVMPTYNGAAYLAAALDSIAAQGQDDIEVIALDDGSTDGTLPLLHRYADRLPLRIVARGRIGSWVANTNHGLSLACGEYVCYLHQDDCWLPHRLATLKARTAAHPEVTLFLHASVFIDATGQQLGTWRCPLSPYRSLRPDSVLERLLVQNFIAIPAPLFRREAALRVGGMDERLWYTADWDFWLKLAAAGETLYDPRPLACFRVHALSQTVRQSRDSGAFRRQHEVVLQRHLPGWLRRHAELQAILPQVAEFSTELNTALTGSLHGQIPNLVALLGRWLALGPVGWHRFLRDSRIAERVLARLRTCPLPWAWAGFAENIVGDHPG